jgi:DNA polymerase I-like protein with 3'-5' exonuclease and polymerase domains
VTIRVPIYSEQNITGDVQKIIQSVIAEYPPQTFQFEDIMSAGVNPWSKVLVFGAVKSKAVYFSGDLELIHTYSMAQIATKANAISVLKAALDQFYLPQKQHPKSILWGGLGRLDPAQPMVVDIETSGNLDTQTPEQVGIISMCFYQNGKWAKWVGHQHKHDGFCDPKCKREVNDIVFNEEQKQILALIEYPIWHNGKFDIRVIEANTSVRMPNFFDTMLAHHVLNQAAGQHKLKPLCRQYLGAPEWEADLSKYTVGGAHYENIPLDILITYNGWDVYWTWELWQYLQPQILADDNASRAYMVEMAASEMLLDVEQFGFAFDVKYAQVLDLDMSADLSKRVLNLQLFCNHIGVTFKTAKPFNPGSWQQVQAVISHTEGKPYTDSTDEKHLMKLRKKTTTNGTINFIDELLEYRGVKIAHSTFVKGALDRQVDGRIHTTFLIHGTSTGRLSSSGPNIQNIPREKKYRSLYLG